MADVGILIKARDEASGTIKNVKSSLNDLGKASGDVTSLSGAFNSLGGAIGLAGLAIGALKVGQVVVDLAQVGAQAQRVEDSYRTLSSQAGISGDQMLAAMQKASGGTIANTELMLTANRALALGVADSADEMSQLMQVAIARGKALGLSAQQAFNDLVTGIGRMSPLILDNLGIITGGEKVFNDYAASIGKSTAALSDAERKQALVNKVIAESRDLVAANAQAGNDAAASFERAAASFQNIKTDLGTLFGPAIAAFADQLAAAVDAVANKLTGDSSTRLQEVQGNLVSMQAFMQEYAAAVERVHAALSAGDTAGFKDAAAAANSLQMRMQGLAQTYNEVAAAAGKPQIDIEALRRGEIAYTDASVAAQKLAAMGGPVAASMAQQAAAAANLGGSLAVLSGEYNRVIALQSAFAGASAQLSSLAGQVIGAAGQTEGLKFLRQQNAALSEQQKAWQDAGYSVAEVTALSYAYNESLRKGTENTYGFGAAATRANKAAAASVKALNAEYENLASKVSGVLSSGLSDIAGVNLDDILPRQDSVSEDARRLADVAVNGFASPWADYLINKFPDTIGAALKGGGDIKQNAAQLLRDFQDGLRPELLDKNRAKELVKRAIIGEKNLKALTDEIAKELAGELGISVAQAQQAAVSALGGGATGVAGTGASEAKQVPIVPIVDTSKLPTTPISITGTIDSVTISQTVKDYALPVAAQITSITVAETVTNPQIASTAAIGEIVIAEGATYPTPVLTGGLTIDAVSVRSDAQLPDISVAATIGILTLDAAVQNPQITLASVIGSMTIAEGVKPPDIVLPAGAFVNVVSLASTAVLPDVTLTANIVAVSLSPSTATETPINLSATVTPFIDTSLMDSGNIDAARTFITEVMPLVVTPQISTEGVDTSTALTYLEQELAPIVTPYINYLGILPEDLAAAGTHIAGGIVTGIANYNLGNAIVTELNKAQLAMRNSGITSGQNWGAGFNSGASEYITSIVSTVVSLALAQIARSATKTGAQP